VFSLHGPLQKCVLQAGLLHNMVSVPPGSTVALPLPIHCCRYQPGLWQHVLPDSRQLLQLTALSTSIPCETSALDLLARSCSQLEELCLCCTAGMELTALLQLTALSSVWLEAPVDSCPVASLAQLSGLQGLERLAITACPQDPCSISDDIVGSLTALTALTLLALPGEDGVLSAAMQQQLQRCEQGPFTQGGVFMDMPWRDRPCCVFTSTVSASCGCARQKSQGLPCGFVGHCQLLLVLQLGMFPCFVFVAIMLCSLVKHHHCMYVCTSCHCLDITWPPQPMAFY